MYAGVGRSLFDIFNDIITQIRGQVLNTGDQRIGNEEIKPSAVLKKSLFEF